MRLLLVCFSIVAFYLLHPGGEGSRGSPALPAVELTLYCGAGIRPAAEALIRRFEAIYPVKINATYAGSGRLLGQIISLQRGDLFMPGAALYVDKAIEEGVAYAETRRIVAYFVPVIFVQKGNPKGIHSLGDFRRKGIRLGFGDERSCAVGRKTLKILAKNGIACSEVKKNVVYKSGTVNELGLAIQMGNVDAVILWDANARHFAESGEVIPIPLEKNVLSAIPIVLLRSSRHPGEAQRLIDFVASEEGRKILVKQGYAIGIRPQHLTK